MAGLVHCFLVLSVLTLVNSERILLVYTFPPRSHHVVFNKLTNELSRRGHELVVITTSPQGNNENITEIHVNKPNEIWFDTMSSKEVADLLQRGVRFTAELLIKDSQCPEIFKKMAEGVLDDEKVKNLLNDKKQKFDLVIGEALFDFPLVFAEVYKAPFVWFGSFVCDPNNYRTIGAPASHPFIYPSPYRNKFYNLSILEKIYELYIEVNIAYNAYYIESLEENLVKKYFGDEMKPLSELKNNVDLFLVNANPAFYGNRPVPPSVVHLGSIHLEPVKPLPQDLKNFLDQSSKGVVYMSFGSNVRPSAMDDDLLDSFLDAIETLPYDFLWKYDAELRRHPKNLRIAKWLPQRDLLDHKNIKAFVTQAGLQSTDEAIDSGVPLVGIPMLAEQSYNAARYEELGIGISLDLGTLTTNDLVRAIKNVIEDKSYKSNISKLGALIRDQPSTPLERAVWWVEHIIRHKGGSHLRSPQANITWSEYLVYDVVLTVTAVTLAVLGLVVYGFRLVLSVFVGRSKVKVN